MKTDFFVYTIDWKNIESDIKNCPILELSYGDLLRELGWSDLIIFENDQDGKFIFLHNVDTLNFLMELYAIFEKLNKKTNNEYTIESMYESYLLKITKKGKKITFSDQLRKCTATFDFYNLYNNLKELTDKVFKDFIVYYPKLKERNDYNKMKCDFLIQSEKA